MKIKTFSKGWVSFIINDTQNFGVLTVITYEPAAPTLLAFPLTTYKAP